MKRSVSWVRDLSLIYFYVFQHVTASACLLVSLSLSKITCHFYWRLSYLSLQHLPLSPQLPLTFPYLDNHGSIDWTILAMHRHNHTTILVFLFFFPPDLLTCNDTAATFISQSTCGATQVLSGAATGLIKPSDAFPVLVCFLIFYFLCQLVPAFLRVREGAGVLPECLWCICT